MTSRDPYAPQVDYRVFWVDSESRRSAISEEGS